MIRSYQSANISTEANRNIYLMQLPCKWHRESVGGKKTSFQKKTIYKCKYKGVLSHIAVSHFTHKYTNEMVIINESNINAICPSRLEMVESERRTETIVIMKMHLKHQQQTSDRQKIHASRIVHR